MMILLPGDGNSLTKTFNKSLLMLFNVFQKLVRHNVCVCCIGVCERRAKEEWGLNACEKYWLTLLQKEMFTLSGKMCISTPPDSATIVWFGHILLLLHVHKGNDAEWSEGKFHNLHNNVLYTDGHIHQESLGKVVDTVLLHDHRDDMVAHTKKHVVRWSIMMVFIIITYHMSTRQTLSTRSRTTTFRDRCKIHRPLHLCKFTVSLAA